MSLTEVNALRLNMSRFHRNEEKVHNEYVPAGSPVAVDSEGNVRARGPLPTGVYRAERMTDERSAYPCRPDFDSWLRERRSDGGGGGGSAKLVRIGLYD